jgi:thiol-disulfide isomerase/thioredoxin
MHSFTRRAALAGTGALAAGTVAALTLPRKPPLPHIATPIVAPGGPDRIILQPFTALTPADPPAPPPPVSFYDVDGKAHSLAEFAGFGLIVNLWATWCVPCVAEMPALQAMAKNLAGDNILVLPLSSDRGGAAVVRAFYAAHGITALPIWLDPGSAVVLAWHAPGLPTSLVIDRRGREQGRVAGAVDWAADATLSAVRYLVG